ncbi:MAG: diacylglycerol kinase family protein [Kiloniellaceae bacterium]
MKSGTRKARIGVITNPGSQRNKKGLAEMTRLLEAAPEARHVVIGSIAEVPEILADFARREIEIVAVAGGDGTVQAALTELYNRRPFARDPLLAVVPRGMTNMIAADVGLKGLKGLARLLQASPEAVARATRRRRILRAENVLNREAQYGMFFGGAGICRAIDACRSKVHPLKVEADAAAAVTLAGLLGGWLFGRRKENGAADSIFYGDRIGMGFDGGPETTMESLIILATTLDRLILGSRPFWGGDAGHLRFTAIAYPPKGLLRYALRILYGGAGRRLPAESYLSRSVERVALTMDCPFTLDGEMFQPTPGRPLVLTAADEAGFVRL